MPAPTFILVASPFLGPQSWAPARRALTERGVAARTLNLSADLWSETDPYPAIGRAAAEEIPDGAVLLAHSGAGGLLPIISACAEGRAWGAVFVDAILPHPGRCWFDTAPESLTRRLRAGAAGARVPPWPSWLGDQVLAALLPEKVMRARLIANAPGVPLAYLTAPAPEVQGWSPRLGCVYLRLSRSYDAEADQAAALGWPSARFDGHHLSIMTEPGRVADMILSLAAALASAGN